MTAIRKEKHNALDQLLHCAV